MMYAVYDESGRITQGNQLYHDDFAKVEAIMRDHGQRFFKEKRALVSPDEWFVSLKAHHSGMTRPKLRNRSVMPITQSAKTVRAGSGDSVVFRNIPKGARCSISSGGHGLYDIVMGDDELEISIPVPCIYRVTFTLWPRRDSVFEVEAVQP